MSNISRWKAIFGPVKKPARRVYIDEKYMDLSGTQAVRFKILAQSGTPERHLQSSMTQGKKLVKKSPEHLA